MLYHCFIHWLDFLTSCNSGLYKVKTRCRYQCFISTLSIGWTLSAHVIHAWIKSRQAGWHVMLGRQVAGKTDDAAQSARAIFSFNLTFKGRFTCEAALRRLVVLVPAAWSDARSKVQAVDKVPIKHIPALCLDFIQACITRDQEAQTMDKAMIKHGYLHLVMTLFKHGLHEMINSS